MKISSKIHKQPGQVQTAVVDVDANGKPFFAGILLGDLRKNQCSELGNEVLKRLTAAQDQCSNTDEVMLIEIRSPERGAERVPQVAERINKHGAAAFFCLDKASYDAVWAALNIRFE